MDKKTEIEQQLDMGFKEPIGNKVQNYKYKTELFFTKLRANSLAKSPFIWISLILTISMIFIQFYYYRNFIERLPKEIPLFLISQNLDLRLASSNYLFWIIILSIALTVFSAIIAIKKYYQFKFISMLIMTNLFIAIFLITISYIKIFGVYIF
jgi:hypothetical protein